VQLRAGSLQSSDERAVSCRPEYTQSYASGLLRTFQHRLKIWRSENALTMVLGAIYAHQAESQSPAES